MSRHSWFCVALAHKPGVMTRAESAAVPLQPLFVLTFSGGPSVGMPYVPPASHVLRRATPTLPDAPLRRCAACAAPMQRGELALGRTGTDAAGAAKLDLHHLRCAAKAAWAFQASLQPMLKEYARRVQRGAPPLTDRELAVIYEELGSDERRAMPQTAALPLQAATASKPS